MYSQMSANSQGEVAETVGIDMKESQHIMHQY